MQRANFSKGGTILNFIKNIPTFFDSKEETISEHSSKAENELLNSPGTQKRKNMSEHSPKEKKSKTSPNKNKNSPNKNKNSPNKDSEPMDDSDPNIENEPSNSLGMKKRMAILKLKFFPKTRKNKNSPIKNSQPIDNSPIKNSQLTDNNSPIKNSQSTDNSPIKNSQPTDNSEILDASPTETISSATSHIKKEPEHFDLKIDSAFKFVYGSEGGSDITKCFANDIFGPEMKSHLHDTKYDLCTGYSPIESLQFKNPSLGTGHFNKKTGNADMMFADQDKSLYIIDMQNTYDPKLLTRARFCANTAWNNQMECGDDYDSLKNISVIVITAFNLFPEYDHYLRYYPIMSTPANEGEESFVIGRMACINLAKFNVPIDQLKTPLERWIFSLKYPSGKNEYDENIVIGDYKIIRRVYERRDEFYHDFIQKDQCSYQKWNTSDKKSKLAAIRIRIKVEDKIETAIDLINTKKVSITEISQVTKLKETFIIKLKEVYETKFHSKPISDILEYYSEEKLKDIISEESYMNNEIIANPFLWLLHEP
jgi:predicted transposase/invertase (TIGR01784 family)